MSSDWTTARVVRDCDGDLWFRGSEGADADVCLQGRMRRWAQACLDAPTGATIGGWL